MYVLKGTARFDVQTTLGKTGKCDYERESTYTLFAKRPERSSDAPGHPPSLVKDSREAEGAAAIPGPYFVNSKLAPDHAASRRSRVEKAHLLPRWGATAEGTGRADWYPELEPRAPSPSPSGGCRDEEEAN